jgi:hypothetical protein
VKTYRRIEITAFRRRVTIVSGGAINRATTGDEVCINDADTQEMIEPESDEGQRVLLEAVRLLEEKLVKSRLDEIE